MQTTKTLVATVLAAFAGACTTQDVTRDVGGARAGASKPADQVTIERTTHGVAHITADDLHALAYGAAYAHAQDNVCLTAQHLVTVRGERSRFFGPTAMGLFGLRALPNEQIDLYVAAQLDDVALERAWRGASEATRDLARGYVAGYNRYLADHVDRLPAPCAGQAWVRPMTEADYRRTLEVSMTQAGVVAVADAVLAAQPPKQAQGLAPGAVDHEPSVSMASAREALRERGLVDSPFGSNAWAFGRETTADGRGVLLGNPHFPWVGVNRFWQMHLTVPGRFDVMGASIGQSPVVQIGFNKDVAWSHTVSTGRRFTLHELALVDGEPTRYVVDGKAEAMTSRSVAVDVRNPDGSMTQRKATVWRSRFGPVIVMPRAGLAWTAKTAYAIQDANLGNVRAYDAWLGFARADRVEAMRVALADLGIPWVNTIAADRHGNAMYADVSVVPDVDAAMLQRCAPSEAAARLFRGAGIVVLDGSKADCQWRQDRASRVPGLTPIERLPVAIRGDWVQNSNDSFVYTHPAQRFDGISPLVGGAAVERPRTRASLKEIPEVLGRGKVTPQGLQRQLFMNQNLMAQLVLPDLLAACTSPGPTGPTAAAAQDGCKALSGWDRTSNGDARGAHLFREFWRAARAIPGVHRVPFDAARPMEGPSGLKMADADVAAKVWAALADAVGKVRTAGFALDAPLAEVQRAVITDEPVGLHGGDEIEGVLNNLGDRATPGIGPRGLRIDYGTSYVQTVGFDDRGPVAHALLTYGQSTNAGSPHVADQLKLYATKQWPALPFHRDDVQRARVGEVTRLNLPR